MGLDVYVGTLTRYYSRDWETAVQRAARESGLKIEIARERPDAEDAVTDPADVESAIVAWRQGLSNGLAKHLSAPLHWPEGMGPPYFTDKPAWDCYSALLVWAAHEEQGDPQLPDVAPADWTTDPAVKRSQADAFESRYGQLLGDTELWLPGRFNFTFSAGDATGQTVTMGSIVSLHENLQELNKKTWRANSAILSEWRRAGADFGAPLEVSARFGFAVFAQLVEAAVHHWLPIKLDY
jgi:hypothetical protein